MIQSWLLPSILQGQRQACEFSTARKVAGRCVMELKAASLAETRNLAGQQLSMLEAAVARMLGRV